MSEIGSTDRTVDLVGEGIDCALRLGELPDSTLVARPLGQVTMVTCAAPGYLKERGEPQGLDDLSAHTAVNFLSGHDNRPMPWQFRVNGKDIRYSSTRGISVTDSNAYVHCGVAGFGIIQAPGIAVGRYLERGELVEILRPWRPRPRPVTLLYPSRRHVAPQVEVFEAWLREELGQLYAQWLEQA